MTLDEAIIHAEEVAEINQTIAYNTDDDNWMDIAQCEKCAKEHRQLAEWLKELKAYREQGNALMDGILKIIHSTIYDFMDVCDDDESPLTDKDKLLLNINKAICNNLKSLHEQFEKNIREFEVKLESGVKIDRGPLLQRKNGALEIITDAINDLPPVTPQPETYTNIPLLLHKEFGCPLDECVKAYEEAIKYLRSKSKLKG